MIDDPIAAAVPASPRRRHTLAWLVVLFVLVLAGLGGWQGWRWWQGQQARQHAAEARALQHLEGVEQQIEALRQNQRASSQRIQDAAATNRVLREEILGIGQRNALLEDTVAKLADPDRHGAQALRLDEIELLLSQGQQRWVIAGDLDGARRAYALAATVLQGVDSPGVLNLRQSLEQERAALDALGDGPQVQLQARLEQFSGQLAQLPQQAGGTPATQPAWWQRLLSPLVQVRASSDVLPVARGERGAAQDALQIELTLARAAAERGDGDGYRLALQRVDTWMSRLWPDSPPLRQRRAELAALQQIALRPQIPELGSTLQQLRSMRDGRSS